ncbi:MAG: tetratricopeptide repeat protein [Planctomycetes bacterium]|nr:tetratricopeptide repeat protein [Planctomycetota bacterium]
MSVLRVLTFAIASALPQEAPPDNALLNARWQAAQQMHVAGEVAAARTEMEAVLASDPRNLDLALSMTRWLVEVRSDFATALPFARRAQELGVEKQDAINLVGSVFTMNGEADQSERVFAAGCERHPSEYVMWFGLGVARAQLMRYLDAKVAFAEALKLSPDNGLVLFSTGENFANLREYAVAERAFALAVKLKGHDDAMWRLGEMLALQGKDELAEKILTQALTNGGKSPRFQAALQLGMFLVERDRAAGALPLLTQATEERPTSREAWRWLARAQRSLGKHDTAARSLKKYQELRAEEDHLEEERLLGLIKAQLEGAKRKEPASGGGG